MSTRAWAYALLLLVITLTAITIPFAALAWAGQPAACGGTLTYRFVDADSVGIAFTDAPDKAPEHRIGTPWQTLRRGPDGTATVPIPAGAKYVYWHGTFTPLADIVCQATSTTTTQPPATTTTGATTTSTGLPPATSTPSTTQAIPPTTTLRDVPSSTAGTVEPARAAAAYVARAPLPETGPSRAGRLAIIGALLIFLGIVGLVTGRPR